VKRCRLGERGAPTRARLAGTGRPGAPFDEQAVRALLRTSPSPCCSQDPPGRDRFRATLKDNCIQTTWYPALHNFTSTSSFGPPGGVAPGTGDRRPPLRASRLSSSYDRERHRHVVESSPQRCQRAVPGSSVWPSLLGLLRQGGIAALAPTRTPPGLLVVVVAVRCPTSSHRSSHARTTSPAAISRRIRSGKSRRYRA